MTSPIQPAPFPHHDAATVRKAAELTHHNPALQALDTVKNMIGHPGNIQRSLDEWENSIRLMSKSFEGISQAESQIQTRWTGGAVSAFITYSRDVKTTVGSNVLAFQNVLDATNNMYGAVIDAYKDAITFVSKCAQALLDFGGGLLGDWKTVLAVVAVGPTDGASLALILKHYTELLSDFAESITNLINSTIEASKSYNMALHAALKGVDAIRPVPGPVKGISDLHAWKAL